MKFSVAMCTYNGGVFLKEQLDSIFSQRVSIDELIICDDGSSDDTVNVVKHYVSKYPKVIAYHQNTKNLGYVRNFEKALSLTTGDIVFLSDQDDVWLPTKVERFLEIFKEKPEIMGVFSDALLIDENNDAQEGTLWESIAFKSRTDLQQANSLLYDYILKTYNVITGCCCAIKKESLKNILPIKSPFWEIHDEYIGLTLTAKNSMYALNECLSYYRIHNNQKVGVPPKSEWEALSIRKQRMYQDFFVGHATYDDMSRLWVYYKRLLHYSSVHKLNEEWLKLGYDYFLQFRSEYINTLGILEKRIKLLSWWKNRIYDIRFSHLIFGKL